MGVAKMEKQQRKQSYIEKRLSVRIRRSKLLQQTENIEYKIATTTDELEQAFELVTQQYISVGMHLKEHELRLTKYHLLPDSKVFIAIKKLPDNKEKVIGTLTVVVDTSMGLPMDEIYKEQLDRIRITGVLLAEVIGLAVTPAESALQNNIVMYLFKMCFQYARFSQVHDLLCSVKQKHVAFYSEVLLFKAIGEAFPYSYANGQLIQGHQLNLFQANKDFENVYSGMEFDADLHRFFFTETKEYNRPYGKGDAMSPEQMRYFIEEKTQLLSSLSNKDRGILRDKFSELKKSFSY